MSEKRYPTDPLGQDDDSDFVPAKPCAHRIDVASRIAEPRVMWCQLPDRHGGQCSSPIPKPLEPNELGPEACKRRRF